MPSCLIVGGGVIGLSLAWELARRGWQVRVLDRAEPGRATSWAGAGILPPAGRPARATPEDDLRRLSYELHPEWAERLAAETGIDNGFRRSGGLYLARGAGEAAALRAAADEWRREGIEVVPLDPCSLAEVAPALIAAEPSVRPIRAAYLLPGEFQVRNPRHLKALIAACMKAGVEIEPHCDVTGIEMAGDRVAAINTTRGRRTADVVCLAAGAWTPQLAGPLGLPPLPIVPIRGQMLLFACERPPLTHIVNDGPRYIVPRDDGHVLVGSTEEEAGYDCRTTEAGLADLQRFAVATLSLLATARLEKSWAGLRPCALRGFPYLGPIPGLANAFVAAGHFRTGIYLSPGTAKCMAQLITGEQPDVDLRWFGIERG